MTKLTDEQLADIQLRDKKEGACGYEYFGVYPLAVCTYWEYDYAS